MKAERAQLIKNIFAEASDRCGTEREEFLAQRCGNDPEIRIAVERLLLADEGIPIAFLNGQPVVQQEVPAPSRIGNFRVLRRIASGGMGAVFEAEQNQPRRRVALKVIRMTMASEALRRRFEHEVEILGQLKHPGIAQIHEAGTFDDGTGPAPYFAMEFVDGIPLVDFAKQHQLTIRQRLTLMAAICDAAHHAHQHDVVHRDLKPANILIERTIDGMFCPKVLDFGVARAIRSDEHFASMHTEVGQLIGTLCYMSPEQVVGSGKDLDTRSDIYTLGVILFELLAHRLPYELHDRSMVEAGSVIREQDAIRLSSIDAAFRGDIETIVSKAMAKEKDRRYQSAAELAADIRRFLSDEPIVARPTSLTYQMRKFAVRNKALASSFVIVLLILIVGFVGISWALVRARGAEHAALKSASKATAVSNFLQNMLAGVDPEEIGPDALTVREVLDHASARLEHELQEQPDVAAAIHQTLGKHYSTLGHYIDADRHLQQAVNLRRALTAGDDPELAQALSDLAVNLQEKRDIARAEGPTREALEMRRRLYGDENLEVAASLYDLASILTEQYRAREAEPLARESLRIRRKILGPENNAVATSIGMLGWCHMALGQLDDAETALRNAVEMVRRLPGDNERALASRLTFLSYVLRTRGKLAEEEASIREAVDIRSRRLAQDHPALAWNLYCLAQVRRKSGDLEEAEFACRNAYKIYLKRRGPQHEDIADCQQLLAEIYDEQGRLVEAEQLWSACLKMRRAVLPREHSDTLFAEYSLNRNREAQVDASPSQR